MAFCRGTSRGLPPRTLVSRRTSSPSGNYSGVNPLLLQLSAEKKGFQSKWWGTYRQWASAGGQVRKRPAEVPAGKWGTTVIFFKPIKTTQKDENGKEREKTFPLLRTYSLFNADQVEGVEQFKVHTPEVELPPNFEPAEKVIAATAADVRVVDADRAVYYYPPKDYVEVPPKASFILGKGGLASWYETVFHELCHWSEPRLKWSQSYAMNELRAEMGAAFLAAEIGIPSYGRPTSNHASYLESWIKTMKEDHRVIFRISSAASAAADCILSFSRAQETKEEEEEVAVA